MSFERDAGQDDAAGLFDRPDGIDLVLDTEMMLCVFDAQRLERIDQYRRDAIRDALMLGGVAPEVVERSVRLEVACALRVTEYSAGVLIHRAEALLHRYPDVYDALAHAQVTPRHTEILTVVLDELEPEYRDRVAARALELAKALPVGDFRRRLRALIDTIRADTIARRHERALAERRVFVEDVGDGMAWLHVYGPAVEARAAYERATGIAKTVIDADRSAGAGIEIAEAVDDAPVAVRSVDQARTDVMFDLLIDGVVAQHPKTARGIRATVVVTVPVLSLLDDDRADGAPAIVEGVGPIPIRRARELCGGPGEWMRVLTAPETGIVVSVGRDRYKPPASLRRLVKWRAGTCMTPGCNVPAGRCEIDHQEDWARGGETALNNLSPLCRAHHTVKGTGLWEVVQTDRGALRWTSPTGRVYLVEPERHLPAFTEPGETDRTAHEPAPF